MIFLGRKLKFVTQYSVGLVFYSVLRLFSVVGWLAAIGILIVLCLGCVLLYCLLKCFRALKSGRRDRIHGKVRTSEQTPLHQHVSVLLSETFIKQSGMNIHHFGTFPSFLIVPFFSPCLFCRKKLDASPPQCKEVGYCSANATVPQFGANRSCLRQR